MLTQFSYFKLFLLVISTAALRISNCFSKFGFPNLISDTCCIELSIPLEGAVVLDELSNFKFRASLVPQRVKNPPCNAGDPGPIPGSGRSPGEENGNLLQYSCLEKNPMDRGAWWATVYGVVKSWT